MSKMTARVFMVDDPSEGKGGVETTPPFMIYL